MNAFLMSEHCPKERSILLLGRHKWEPDIEVNLRADQALWRLGLTATP